MVVDRFSVCSVFSVVGSFLTGLQDLQDGVSRETLSFALRSSSLTGVLGWCRFVGGGCLFLGVNASGNILFPRRFFYGFDFSRAAFRPFLPAER